jgi:undecaprenyl-diphosphatase
MDSSVFSLVFNALILGVVEGLTEFLPISSTGHLILVSDWLGSHDEKGKVFEIVIQVGAILAVCWEFRQRLWQTVSGLHKDRIQRRFALNVIIATLPAIILALIFGKAIKAALFNPFAVAVALVVGGMIILLVEKAQTGPSLGWFFKFKSRHYSVDNPLLMAAKLAEPRIHTIDDLTPFDALKVGLAQCFALIPGTSRSGSTIIGGMLFGIPRTIATQFSFFLAIPVLCGAAAYELIKNRHLLEINDFLPFSIGFFAAFVSAFICVRWLLKFVASHDFKSFAWYRIILGSFILVWAFYFK